MYYLPRGVNPGVSASGTEKLDRLSGNGTESYLECGLNGALGVGLDLPAIVGAAVVFDSQRYAILHGRSVAGFTIECQGVAG